MTDTAKAEALWAKTPENVKEKWMACECDAGIERHKKAWRPRRGLGNHHGL